MNFDPNDLFYQMVGFYKDNRNKGHLITICNEGSSRSSKTWDFYHFLVYFCDQNRNKGFDIYILRDTLVNCRDRTLKDFKDCLEAIGVFNESLLKEYPKPEYKLFGNNVYFRGLDDSSEAPPSDIVFINEALETEKSKVKGWRMRCRKLIVYDWNPKFTSHWCFDLQGQPYTLFTHSTYRNNKHLQQSVVNEIESYEPWMPGSYQIIGNEVFYGDHPVSDTNQPPEHPTNVKNGSADMFQWRVYGLGLRSAMDGLILTNVRYIDEFPDVGFMYGVDFGFTVDPFAMVKYSENKTDIYSELLCYKPIDNPEDIDLYVQSKKIDVIRTPIIADSSDKYTSETRGAIEMVKELRGRLWNIEKVSKTKSVMYWLTSMKKKRLNIVKNNLYHHFKKEQENYIMKKINGQSINQPIDGFDHAISATRYCHMAWNENKTPSFIW